MNVRRRTIRIILFILLLMFSIIQNYLPADGLPAILGLEKDSFLVISTLMIVVIVGNIAFDMFAFENKVSDLVLAANQVNPVTRLPQYSRKMSEIIDLISQSLERFRDDKNKIALIEQRVEKIIESTINELEELERGRFNTTYWTCTILTDKITRMKPGDDLLGITNWDQDCEWWETEDADKFLEANYIAIQSKCTIKRIFVYTKLTPELVNEMKKHLKLGVKVYTLNYNKIPSHELAAASCVICDALTYEAKLSRENRIELNHFSVNSIDIHTAREKLSGLLRMATPYKP